MIFAVFMAFFSALAVLVCLWRMDIRKFMGYPAIMDFSVTLVLIAMLHGSYVGMVAAVLGGLMFSGMITLLRKYYGYKRLTLKGWVTYDGSMTTGIKNIEAHSFNRLKTFKGNIKCFHSNLFKLLPICIGLLFVLLFMI